MRGGEKWGESAGSGQSDGQLRRGRGCQPRRKDRSCHGISRTRTLCLLNNHFKDFLQGAGASLESPYLRSVKLSARLGFHALCLPPQASYPPSCQAMDHRYAFAEPPLSWACGLPAPLISQPERATPDKAGDVVGKANVANVAKGGGQPRGSQVSC